ncbi:hypothetical protein SH528x_004843 [Novipirellula sp. SH528]|uniref:hypothetical protein n=1 Tax=Novipirellula sp. SH528 TaxID=3454466 RepID=UPI003FA1154C
MLDPQSIHWRFATGNAFRALETQVRKFDFATCADGHTYSGLNPQEYIDIIDGFLAEDLDVVPVGNRSSLQELRKLLVHHILAAFNVGFHTAVEVWNNSDRQYGSLDTPDLHALARDRSPFSGLKTEWFVEGFCQSYAQTEMESLRDAP